MSTDSPPGFLSLKFHLRFFPHVLWNRLRPGKRAVSGFPSFEPYLALVICLTLLVIGIPKALIQRSLIGWVMAGLGAAGFLALLIQSISSWRGERPSYDRFLIGFFFFFIVLGLTAGVFVGALHHLPVLGLLVGAAGLLAGYLLGIFAGLWFQYLGWITVLLDILAGLAIVGMIVVDLVLLIG